MVNSIAIAWAVPVDVKEIGPFVQAYVEQKAIKAFLECVHGRLPPEISEMITDFAKPDAREYLAPWLCVNDWCLKECHD